MRNLNKKIDGAENFKYKEFIKSDVAIRKNINNIPSEKEWKNIEKLAVNILQPVRKRFGRIRILSGYRVYELNKLVGGSPYSNHIRAEAADIEPINDKISLLTIVGYMVKNLEFRNVILEYPWSGWIHCDYREGGNIKRLKLKDKDHNYEEITLVELETLYSKKGYY